MSAQGRPRRWHRRFSFRLSHLLGAIALVSLGLSLVDQHQRNAALRRENLKLAEYKRRVVNCVRVELIWALGDMQGFNIHFDRQEEDYIEAERRVRQKLGSLLLHLPDREEVMRRMKHEHDTGAWAPGRIRETAKND